ncbi:hypothetical protein B0H19DRAFT_1263094 [Mycena capillaripes]|nr:hypothetical protein B0H19DRAFT_1263094 [Mycena capillaripes]
MNYNQYGDGSTYCGKLRINYNGKSTVATCVDECATCDVWGSIDLTKGLFTYLVGAGGLDQGEFWGSWSFVDGNDDPPPPPPKKTTTRAASTTPAYRRIVRVPAIRARARAPHRARVRRRADNIAHFSEAMLGLMGLVVQGAEA